MRGTKRAAGKVAGITSSLRLTEVRTRLGALQKLVRTQKVKIRVTSESRSLHEMKLLASSLESFLGSWVDSEDFINTFLCYHILSSIPERPALVKLCGKK